MDDEPDVPDLLEDMLSVSRNTIPEKENDRGPELDFYGYNWLMSPIKM